MAQNPPDSIYIKEYTSNKSLIASIEKKNKELKELKDKHEKKLNQTAYELDKNKDEIDAYKQKILSIQNSEKILTDSLAKNIADTSFNAKQIKALTEKWEKKNKEARTRKENLIKEVRTLNNEIKEKLRIYDQKLSKSEVYELMVLQERIKIYINENAKSVKDKITRIITSADINASKNAELDNLIEDLPCEKNNYKSLVDSVEKYKQAANFINSVKSFLKKGYNTVDFDTIKSSYPEIDKSTILFNNEQTTRLRFFVNKLYDYCEVYSLYAGQINSYLNKNLLKNSNDLREFQSFLKQDIANEFTYLYEVKKKLNRLIEESKIEELKSQNQLNITKCD